MFLALTPFMFVYPGPPTGLPVLTAKQVGCGPGDGRTVVIHVLQGGKIKLNMEDSDRVRLGGRLYEIFKTRAEKVLFISADPHLSFQDVAQAIDIATKHIDNVALICPTQKMDISHCLSITPWPRRAPRS
jgi:biopolymer transport protein TolR